MKQRGTMKATGSAGSAGSAGASAQREHDRRLQRRRLEVRSRHPVMWRHILRTVREPQTIRALSTGAVGEQVVGRRLDLLAGRGVVALHDRRIPGSFANIDHIVVSASGIFVIDAKHYAGARVKKAHSGSLFGRSSAQLLVRNRNRTHLASKMVNQKNAVLRALGPSAEVSSVPITLMLAFVNARWPFFQSPFEVNGVWVVNPTQMARIVSGRGCVDATTVRKIANRLSNTLKAA